MTATIVSAPESEWPSFRKALELSRYAYGPTDEGRPEFEFVDETGTEVPLELVYLGVRGGLHQWQAVWVLAERPVSIRGGMIPARTAVSIAWKAQP